MIFFFQNWYRRFHKMLGRRWSVLVIFLISMVLYGTTGFMYFESAGNPELTWLDSLWWALVTMTTVGYGDFFPTTTGGRLFVGLPIMLLGVSVLGYLLSLLASGILETKIKEVRGMAQIECNQHVILGHYNGLESTLQIVEELRRDSMTANCPIVLIDEQLEELPRELAEAGLHFVRGHIARDAVLDQANVAEAKYVLLQAMQSNRRESDHRNLAAALIIHQKSPEAFLVVHGVDPENTPTFKRAGCSSVVCLSSLVQQLMIQELQDPGVHDVLSQLTSNKQGKQFYIIPKPPGAATYKDLQSRFDQDDSVLIGIRRGNESILLPPEDSTLEASDQAILIATHRPA